MSNDKGNDEFDEEEEARYQKWVQRREREKQIQDDENRRRDLEVREAKVAEKEAIALKEERATRSLSSKRKRMGYGRIIFGTILIICVVLVMPYLQQFKAVQDSNLQKCSGVTGAIDQYFSESNQQICANAPQLATTLSTGIFIGYLLGLIGFVLIILGLIRR